MAAKLKLKMKRSAAPVRSVKAEAPKRRGRKPSGKRGTKDQTRVNFDVENALYASAADAARKSGKALAAVCRLFLQSLADTGKPGRASEGAQAAKVFLSMDAPEGSRSPTGMRKEKAPVAPKGRVGRPPKAKVAAAPVRIQRAAPAPARVPVRVPVRIAAAAPRPVVAAPAPLRFVLRRPAA